YLADPTHLSDTIAERFASQVARVRHGSWRWDVPEVQAHFRGVAGASLATLTSLIRIAGAQEHLRGESARALIQKVNRLLVHYLSTRHRIPTKSRWFGERYEHPQWYLTDATRLESATRLAGSMTPTSVPDIFWVEKQLVPELIAAISSGVTEDLKRGAPGTGFETLGALADSWFQFGANWSSEEAIRYTRELSESVLGALTDASPERGALGPAVGDAIGLVPIALELGFHRTLEPSPVAEIDRHLLTADWSSSKSPYFLRLPRRVIAALEEAAGGVRFEHDARAPTDTRTPPWYVRELALFHYEREMQAQITALIDFLAPWFTESAARLSAVDQPEAAGAILTRGLECAWKLEHHLDHWRQTLEELRERGELVDFHRPSWDWQTWETRVKQMVAAIQLALARLIPDLAALNRDEEIPDYLGQAMHLSAEACIEALRAGEAERFRPLFSTFFYGALAMTERVREAVADHRPEQAVALMTQPLIDAVDLSGYALIYSEFHQDPALWEGCREIWECYLGGEKGEEALRTVAAWIAYENGRLGFSPRAILRQGWKRSLSGALQELPRRPAQRGRFYEQGEVEHPSPLIRHLAPNDDLIGMLHGDAIAVFVALYLAKREGDAELDFGLRDGLQEDLQEAVEEANDEPDGEESESEQ
ncbi:MAG TPA: hypothetical protein VFP23_04950, partial [Solirubrobacterales bacterium]|nr:hypothetical protein [Solirubrobacterales bacterium]